MEKNDKFFSDEAIAFLSEQPKILKRHCRMVNKKKKKKSQTFLRNEYLESLKYNIGSSEENYDSSGGGFQ